MTRAQDILTAVGERLGGSAHIRNIFGEPVNAGDRTIIPVGRIGYGMGAGAGGIDKNRAGEVSADRSGGGGGGGMMAVPVGVVEITPSGTHFIPFAGTKRIAAAAGIAFLAGVFMGRRRKSR